MAENKKGYLDVVKNVLNYILKTISAGIVLPIEGFEIIADNIENRIIQMEKRILRKMLSFFVISVGALFLIFALLFYLMEYMGWSKSVALFSIGITIFIIGLLLKVRELMIKNN